MSLHVEPFFILFENFLDGNGTKAGYPGYTDNVVLETRNTPSRAAMPRRRPPNWLVADTSCAPEDASKRRRERRKENIGHAAIGQTEEGT